MINCQNAKEIINEKLDGEIKYSEQIQLEEHLSSCHSCNIYQENLLKLHNALNNLPEPKVNFSFVDQLVETNHFRINNRVSSKFNWKKISPLYGIAVAAVLFVLIIPLSGLFDKQDFESARIYDGVKQSSNETVPNDKIKESQFGYLIESEPKLEGITNFDSAALNVEDKVEGNMDNNKEFDMAIRVASDSNFVPKVIDNQLIIYSNDLEIYRTDKWEEDLTVEWYIEDDNIIYSLFNKDGNLEGKYKINLSEKKEEKITE